MPAGKLGCKSLLFCTKFNKRPQPEFLLKPPPSFFTHLKDYRKSIIFRFYSLMGIYLSIYAQLQTLWEGKFVLCDREAGTQALSHKQSNI